MRYELPKPVVESLAKRSMRLHHLLWHVIRNSWHDFSAAERATMLARHPAWVPLRPRFRKVPVTPQNPSGVELNLEAGESFLYMHREMILSVNARLVALGEPALVAWPDVPEPADADYPVPGRTQDGASDDVKSDVFGRQLSQRARRIRSTEFLRGRPLAAVGAVVESAVHDAMHGRWAEISPGAMEDFPPLDPTNVNPELDTRFDAPSVDWLGHPYSSHVSSVFWKLHGWCDEVIDAWRSANGVAQIQWADTWVGDSPAESANLVFAHKLDDHPHPGHGAEHDLLSVFATISRFPGCHVGFDYVFAKRIPIESALL